MIQKNVDLIAIALLLATIAFCSNARNAIVLGIRTSRTVRLSQHYQRLHTRIQAIPRIPFARD